MRLQAVQEEEEECDLDRITAWLEDLHIASESEEDEKQGEKAGPITPPRRMPGLIDKYDEFSPTDTTFSGASIFDKEYTSPCPEGKFRDDISDATNLDPNDEYQERELFAKDEEIEELADALAPESLNSYDPASDIDDPHYTHQLQPTTADLNHCVTDPSKPRLVTILSCLQCTLASLPCSRTPPYCSRCVRNTNSTNPPCLLLRRRFPHELTTYPPQLYTLPVVLRRIGESEEDWPEKMKVKEKLLQEWREKEERKNWVMPKIEIEVRGGWQGRGKRKVMSGRKKGEEKSRWEGEGMVIYWVGEVVEGGVEL